MSKDQNKKEDYESFAKKANENAIEGRNPVLEAFRAGKPVDRLYVLDGCRDGAVLTIKREAVKAGTVIKYVDKDRLDHMSPTGHHQGVIAITAAYEYSEVSDILKRAEEKGEDPFIIILDGIEDPHNLDIYIMFSVIIKEQSLCGSLPLVIARANPYCVNTASVFFRLRVHFRVTIDFTC
jgi:23S rRNA (guanosine2251-2'-O)-methyltransferase